MRLIFAIAFVVLVAGCSSTPETKKDPMSASWKVVQMGARMLDGVDASMVPTLAFDPVKLTVGGNAGCNTYNGAYQTDINSFSFGKVAVTLKACETDVMTIETQFLDALTKTAKMKIDDDELMLIDASGVELLKAKAQE